MRRGMTSQNFLKILDLRFNICINQLKSKKHSRNIQSKKIFIETKSRFESQMSIIFLV